MASPAPSGTPAPSVDVAGVFKAAYMGADSGTIRATGTVTIGDQTKSFSSVDEFTVNKDSRQLLIVGSGASAFERELITIGDDRYIRESPGPWLPYAQAATESDQGMGGVIAAAAASVVDRGPTTFMERPARRLEPTVPGALVPAMFGVEVAEGAEVRSTITFYALEDGTPLGIELGLSWTVPPAVDPSGSIELTMDLADLGELTLILKPKDVWVVYKSRNFDYSLAHPEPWFENPGKDEDSFTIVSTDVGGTDIFLGGSRLIIDRYPLPSAKLSDAARAVVSAREKELGGKATMEDVEVAGRSAVLVTSSGIADGLPLTAYDVIVVRGKTFYDLLWVADMSGMVMDELAIFRELLTTFEFT